MFLNARANALLYLYTLQYSVLPEGIAIIVEQLNHRSILGLQTPFLGAELKEEKKPSQQPTQNTPQTK
jgi:hypothetical protein